MGYDMRFDVVDKKNCLKKQLNNIDFCYGEIIATYEYCVDNGLADFVDKNGRNTNCYIYVNDKETVQDCYGDYLKEVTIDELLTYLYDNEDTYRRQRPFIKMLEGFREVKDKFEDLVVLRFGH